MGPFFLQDTTDDEDTLVDKSYQQNSSVLQWKQLDSTLQRVLPNEGKFHT